MWEFHSIIYTSFSVILAQMSSPAASNFDPTNFTCFLPSRNVFVIRMKPHKNQQNFNRWKKEDIQNDNLWSSINITSSQSNNILSAHLRLSNFYTEFPFQTDLNWTALESQWHQSKWLYSNMWIIEQMNIHARNPQKEPFNSWMRWMYNS